MFKKVLINMDPLIMENVPSDFKVHEEMIRRERDRWAFYFDEMVTDDEEGVVESHYNFDHFDWLSDEDLSLIFLRFYLGLSQSAIAKIIKGPGDSPYSQSSITYRLKILKRKLELIQELRQFDFYYVFDKIYSVTKSKFLSYMILLLMRTLNQFQVSKILGISQGKVRHLFLSIKRLFNEDAQMLVLFDLISNWGLMGKCSRIE